MQTLRDMKSIQLQVYSLMLASGMICGALAGEPSPDQIREKFARSGHPTLELAAEALGDDGLMNMLAEFRTQTNLEPMVKKIVESLKKR